MTIDRAPEILAANLSESPDAIPDAATVRRAAEGLAAARDLALKAAIDRAWQQLEPFSSGTFSGNAPDRVSGRLRRCLLGFCLRLLFRVEVENPERIPPGASILAANHLNHIDPFLLLAIAPPQPYYYVFGDARSLYNRAWKRWFLYWAGGTIPIERRWKEERAVLAAAEAGCEELQSLARDIEQHVPPGDRISALRRFDRLTRAILAAGDGFTIFPEGRLGESEAHLHLPFKRGTVLYALRSGVPIVPAAIVGTHQLYWRKRLTVRFGEPLRFVKREKPKARDIDEALERLQEAIAKLLPDRYIEPPGIKLGRKFLNHMFW